MNEVVRIPSITGVDLALRVAGPGARSYAFLIDWHIRVLLALAWLALGALVTGQWITAQIAPPAFIYGVLLPVMVIYLLYHPLLEVLMRGRTPGKRMAGVCIVMQDGSVPGSTPLLIRNVLRLLDSLPGLYLVGLVATVVTRNSVRIGDLAAGTLLVYEDTGNGTAASLARDREAIARHGLDRVELALELLERWRDLAPAARQRMSRQLLGQLGDPPDEGLDDTGLLLRLREHVGS